MPCRIVAATTIPTIHGSRCKSCPYITLSISVFVLAGSTSPAARFTTINPKLPASSHRRGCTSFQTSGRIFFSFGFGRLFVRSAAVALPVPREGLSPEGIPLPNPVELIVLAIAFLS